MAPRLRPLSSSNPPVFRLILLIINCFLISGTFAGPKKKGGGGDGGGLNDLLGGFDLDGMLSGMQELLGNADSGGGPSAADGKKGKGLDNLKQMAANLDPKMLQDILGKFNTEKVSETIKNMVIPENIWAIIPAHVKVKCC